MQNRYTKRTFFLEVVMIGLGVLWAIPGYILLNYSVRIPSDVAGALALPSTFTLDNYTEAWNEGGLGPALVNTLIITIASLVLIIVLSIAASYPLARSTRRWSKTGFYLFMAGLLVPPQLALIPLYNTMLDLGLIGNIWALVIFYTGLLMPFSVFLYTNFLREMPLEYEEAASMDGATPFQRLWRIVFPLSLPVTGTVIILNAIAIWNDFLTPLLWLTGAGSGDETVAIAVFSFAGEYVTRWNPIFAGIVISLAPVLTAFFALQRQVMKSFGSGVRG